MRFYDPSPPLCLNIIILLLGFFSCSFSSHPIPSLTVPHFLYSSFEFSLNFPSFPTGLNPFPFLLSLNSSVSVSLLPLPLYPIPSFLSSFFHPFPLLSFLGLVTLNQSFLISGASTFREVLKPNLRDVRNSCTFGSALSVFLE